MTQPQQYAVWDSYIRGYHWLQAFTIGGLWYTGTEGLMDWHFSLAYLLLTLLTTRLIWGVIGSETAQFRHFIRSPKIAIQYLIATVRGNHNDKSTSSPGHNPAGAYMVVAFMLLLVTQLSTGLFANDDIISEGPFAHLVSGETSSFLTDIHALNFNVILGAICIHLAAITLYFLRKDNLITPMLTGKKVLDGDTLPKVVSGILAWVIFLIIGTIVYFTLAQDVVAYLF
ncbi:cytochrome b/b6 domain-containing protein [Photobacterium sp. DNB23_23_1]|uniref:Cytochrome b/b6 domain-containing protein n=1 Tax=Photobacterium pectinilyticum TaxID=2906793 RepID=A0ABT1N328_9GAMM|nr:cytochrome b/b6 domain-containing protein [Photobacterium sp. ZSDE20]MCQ1059137.1 cytochrome b/b6 domain-containing protein [Photobacterium sp. ZSDE20]MDD1824368.1 cytochrome b/b6 domain-containing protein [Photobacterium sp. ZSDE20]